jgi:BirA family biotin operon repressor/biotin-[acetyl-CoA-carboxylase] ligase
MLDSEVRAALRDLPLGGLRVFQRVGSTNDVALAWARDGAPDLSLIVADEQTAGRGRAGRQWYTPPGKALALSLIMRPTVEEAAMASRFPGLGCLTVTDVLAELGLDAAIKWPNDVLLSGKKVAGVLSEAIWIGESLDATVLGIGINALEGSAPVSGMQFPATTIESEMARPPDRLKLLKACVSTLLAWRAELASKRFWIAWRDRLAYVGQRVMVSTSGQEVLDAVLVGLDSDGSLLLQNEGGSLHVRAGDIRLRPTNDRMK